MTRSQIHREAELRANIILQQVAKCPQKPNLVPLSHYPTSEDFQKILGPNPGWSWRDHCAVNHQVAGILARHGLAVRFVDVPADKLFAWLLENNLANTTENRAKYVAVFAITKTLGITPIGDDLGQN